MLFECYSNIGVLEAFPKHILYVLHGDRSKHSQNDKEQFTELQNFMSSGYLELGRYFLAVSKRQVDFKTITLFVEIEMGDRHIFSFLKAFSSKFRCCA